MTRLDRREAIVGLGANLGDRRQNLERALELLEELDGVHVVSVSGFMETAPVGGPAGQPDYLNGAAVLRTRLAPRELLDALLAIEARLGRRRVPGVVGGPRTIDLDLLLHGDVSVGDLSVAGPELTLPHPGLEERSFVLGPLAELRPDLVLPGCGRTVAARLAELEAATAAVRPGGSAGR